MKTKMRPRYYCDHCKKGSGSPSHMIRHERGCTLNPHRACGVCKNVGPDVAALSSVALTGDIAKLIDAADGCPACVLAAIRQANWPTVTDTDNDGLHPFTRKEIPSAISEWNFRESLDTWWREMNASAYENDPMYERG